MTSGLSVSWAKPSTSVVSYCNWPQAELRPSMASRHVMVFFMIRQVLVFCFFVSVFVSTKIGIIFGPALIFPPFYSTIHHYFLAFAVFFDKSAEA
jgi:hypothetical protein